MHLQVVDVWTVTRCASSASRRRLVSSIVACTYAHKHKHLQQQKKETKNSSFPPKKKTGGRHTSAGTQSCAHIHPQHHTHTPKIHLFTGRAVKRERRKGSSRRQQPAYGAAVNEVARELLRSARSPKRENGGRGYIHDGMIASPVGSCLCCWQLPLSVGCGCHTRAPKPISVSCACRGAEARINLLPFQIQSAKLANMAHMPAPMCTITHMQTHAHTRQKALLPPSKKDYHPYARAWTHTQWHTHTHSLFFYFSSARMAVIDGSTSHASLFLSLSLSVVLLLFVKLGI